MPSWIYQILRFVKSAHPEYTLYRVIQPTGLMYGQSVASMGIPDIDHWDEKEKLKILLTESLISSSLLFYDNPLNTEEDLSVTPFSKPLRTLVIFTTIFFLNSLHQLKLFSVEKNLPLELAETVLDKRIEHASNFGGNFWIYFFHNSLLFLDVFIFGQWIHTNADRIVADFFRYEREELRFSVVKVIAAASHANKEVALEERRLYEYFVESTDLSFEAKEGGIENF